MKAEVTFSDGRTATITGDTQEQIVLAVEEYEASLKEHSVSDYAKGALEVGRTVVQGSAAEPVAGLAGIGTAIASGPEAGAEAVEAVRSRLSYAPESEAGQEILGDIQYAFDPLIGLAERGTTALGEAGAYVARQISDTDVSGAIGTAVGETVPAAAAAVLGGATGRGISRRHKLDQYQRDRILSGDTDAELAGLRATEYGTEKDVLAKRAIKQGFEPRVVQMVKQASDSDKKKMAQMVNTLQKGKGDMRYSMLYRPSDTVGESLAKRARYIGEKNRQAGKDIDAAARGLKGQQVEYRPAVDRFVDELEDMGVEVDLASGKTRLSADSDIEGLQGIADVVQRVVTRMYATKTPDAYDVHRLKRWIDEQVSYGKRQEGLGGRTEGIIKQLRRDLDQALDDSFPEYNRANTQYAETRQALDDLQSVAGSKIDITGDTANRGLGVLARRVTSNYQSRDAFMRALSDVERVATKYGGSFDDDILTLAAFNVGLEDVFGPVAKTSFRAEVGKGAFEGATEAIATGQGKAGVTAAMGRAAIHKLRGINEDKAYEAIRDLLMLSQRPRSKSAKGLPVERQSSPQPTDSP